MMRRVRLFERRARRMYERRDGMLRRQSSPRAYCRLFSRHEARDDQRLGFTS